MAFSLNNWGEWAGGEAKGQIQVAWTYASSGDTLATIVASGYFNDVTDSLQQDDLIWAVGSDDAELLKVTSATGASTVTVAQVTGASANLPLADLNILVGNSSGVATAVPFTNANDVPVSNGTAMQAKTFAAQTIYVGQHSYGGGGTSTAITVTGLTTSDRISVTLTASTNAVNIQKAVVSADTITVTFSADPGASTTVDYIAMRPF